MKLTCPANQVFKKDDGAKKTCKQILFVKLQFKLKSTDIKHVECVNDSEMAPGEK